MESTGYSASFLNTESPKPALTRKSMELRDVKADCGRRAVFIQTEFLKFVKLSFGRHRRRGSRRTTSQ
jgi:hypothetical protein